MQIQLIKNEQDHTTALAVIATLMGNSLTEEQADQLELLSLLVENYERKMYPIQIPTAIEAIRFRMDQEGLKKEDLVKSIGSLEMVENVLSGTLDLTIGMIRNLNQHLGISLEVLAQEPKH